MGFQLLMPRLLSHTPPVSTPVTTLANVKPKLIPNITHTPMLEYTHITTTLQHWCLWWIHRISIHHLRQRLEPFPLLRFKNKISNKKKLFWQTFNLEFKYFVIKSLNS